MLRVLPLLTAAAVALFSCSGSSGDLSGLQAAGGAKYGGVFRFMLQEKVTTLLPIQSSDVYSQRVIAQIFDPILGIDASGRNVVPAIAESIAASKDGREYTLKIRSGVYFHDDPCFDGEGRELTAEDVKFTLDMACSGLDINESSWLLTDRIEGAAAFFNSTKKEFREEGVSGIQVVDRNTLRIVLSEPCAFFDKILSFQGFGVFPKEAYTRYGRDLKTHPVGTGPFILQSNTAKAIKLGRNPRYWKKDQFGNQLPFLEAVEISYATDKRSELLAFRKAQIDMVLELPADEVENALGSLSEAQAGKTVKHKVDSRRSASVTYLGLAHGNPAFKDLRVRRALNMAIDRNTLVNTTLMGEGYPALHGFIPDNDMYNADRVKGFRFDPAAAQSLLAQAGFPGGTGFPQLMLYVSGVRDSDNHKIAKGIAGQLKANLNIDLQIKLCSIQERNDAISGGKAAIWVAGWVADYPDPENFLSLFYGGNIVMESNVINPFKYKSAQYNKLYDQAAREMNAGKRMSLIIRCDQQLVDDAVVIPVLSDDLVTMINSRVRNFETNSLELVDLSAIFIKEPR
jgi:oligopeptide transport system substrate-binding protein